MVQKMEKSETQKNRAANSKIDRQSELLTLQLSDRESCNKSSNFSHILLLYFRSLVEDLQSSLTIPFRNVIMVWKKESKQFSIIE